MGIIADSIEEPEVPGWQDPDSWSGYGGVIPLEDLG